MFDSTFFLIVAIIAIVVQGFLLLLALFQPALKYKLPRAAFPELDSPEFLRALSILCDAQVHRERRVEVLTNGDQFYEAELEAIRRARHSINLEAYIFQKGEVARKFIDSLSERARAGVQVNMVLDAIGSFGTWNSYFRQLCESGGRVEWYHPLNWHTWPRINNRTHRELIVVDGEVGFVGGAGFGDHWLISRDRHPRWRDSMFKVTGEAVAGLQATFIENWLEASGELLAGKEYFPFCCPEGETSALVINSSPSAGQSTRARILYQTLLASARKSIHITTPYFLPDQSARAEMVRAIRKRGVKVKIVVPGHRSDHFLTRHSSRRLYGFLLNGGARIFEYEPSMIHTKAMIIDELWSVVGSTNFDHRSFGLNDEVNLAAFDRSLAARLEEDFRRDVANSREVKLSDWRRRPIFERAHEYLGWLFERQQ